MLTVILIHETVIFTVVTQYMNTASGLIFLQTCVQKYGVVTGANQVLLSDKQVTLLHSSNYRLYIRH